MGMDTLTRLGNTFLFLDLHHVLKVLLGQAPALLHTIHAFIIYCIFLDTFFFLCMYYLSW